MSNERTGTRQSGIELLKIIAIVMIVLSHAVSSLKEAQIGFLDLTLSTHNPQYLCLTFFWNLGMLGNLMFLIPSVWFLSNTKSLKLNKISAMVGDAFAVSIIGLIVYIVWGGVH